MGDPTCPELRLGIVSINWAFRISLGFAGPLDSTAAQFLQVKLKNPKFYFFFF